MVSGQKQVSKQPHKQTSKHAHEHVQGSSASMGSHSKLDSYTDPRPQPVKLIQTARLSSVEGTTAQ